MYSTERQSRILELLQATGSVSVSDLAEKFTASKETIRRDLSLLESQGKLIRTHGGALSQQPEPQMQNLSESPVLIRAARHREAKDRICQYAAAQIENGDTIFVDNSTTCLSLYRYIPEELQVTILTNSVSFLMECAKTFHPNHMIVCLGGMLKQPNLSIYGSMTIENAKQYLPGKAFLSCTGIVSESNIFDSGIQEVDVKRLLIQNAKKVYLLADHTKFRPEGQVFLGDFSDIDYIITDCVPDLTQMNLSAEARSKIISLEERGSL